MTCIEAAPDHNNGTGTDPIEAAQDDSLQHNEDRVEDPTVTHHTDHTANPSHTTAHQATPPRTAVDYIHAHPTNCLSIVHTKRYHTVQDHTSTKETEKSHLRRNMKVQIEEPPLDYYSSDDHFTDSEEESDSLN